MTITGNQNLQNSLPRGLMAKIGKIRHYRRPPSLSVVKVAYHSGYNSKPANQGAIMEIDETKKLLAAVSAFDNRKPDLAVVIAWQSAIRPDISLPEAIQAVTEHFAGSNDWIGPADINRIVKETRGRRVAAEHANHGRTYPEITLSPDEELIWIRARTEAISLGATRDDATSQAWAVLGRSRPEIEETNDYKNQIETITTRIGNKYHG